jgi:predicted HicB family RNase H-like nuclease
LPNQHKTYPVSLRVPEALRAWAAAKAAAEQRSIASVYTQALQLLRDSEEQETRT